jgi:hypothetical protein
MKWVTASDAALVKVAAQRALGELLVDFAAAESVGSVADI